MLPQILKIASELRLIGLKDSIERRLEEATKNGLHHAEFLQLVLEDERFHRAQTKGLRLSKKAKFRSDCVIEEWDSSLDRGVAKSQINEWARLGFLQRKQNLILEGKTGVGKSHLAIALGRRACAQGYSVLYFSTNLLFEEVLTSRAQNSYLKFLLKIAKTELLILDDFGLRTYNHDEAIVLNEILDMRYGKGSVIFTSQINPNGWKSLFEDPVIGEAIIDRILNPSELISLTGPTYRGKK